MSDVFDGTFVEAYAISTGAKQTIPKAWLDDPVLGADFKLTPTGEENQRLAGGPSEDWTNPELKAYAEEHGIDLGGASKKAELLAAIEAHLLVVPDPDSGAVDGSGSTLDPAASEAGPTEGA